MSDWPPFSSDPFLDLVRDVFFPRGRKALVECEGVRVRTLVTGRNTAVSALWQFPFYLEPLAEATQGPTLRVPYLGDVVVAVTTAAEAGPPGAVPAPFVRWDGFASWEEYLASRRSLPGLDSPKTVLRKARRLARELGPLAVCLDDPDEDVFETLLRWKSAQYRRHGGLDRLSTPQILHFYREMRRRGMFKAVSLKAGGRLIAGRVGFRHNGRFLSRVTVYDPALRDYSPGSVMALEALRAFFEQGLEEFDYLAGDEPHKYTYATHIRWLGSVGAEPRLDRARRVARARIGRAWRGRAGHSAFERWSWRAGQAWRRLRRDTGEG